MSDTTVTNPRAVAGDNQAPDYAQRVTEQMARDYAALAESTSTILLEANILPVEVTGPEESERLSIVVKAMRDTIARAEAFRTREKEPFLRGGNAVDQFFKGLQTRLDKGAGILHARIHVYNEKRRIAEQQRRQEEERRARQEAANAAAKLAEEQHLAAEAAAAAARARKQENIDAHEQRAGEHATNADSIRVDAMIATAAADEARIATLQKPAEMVRERFDSGVLNTMVQKPYVEITDKDALDKEKIWPFLKEEHILMALKAYAKTTNHKKPMVGAIIEIRAETAIR